MEVPRIERVTQGELVEVNKHLLYRTDIVRGPNGKTFPYTHVVDDYAAVATVAMKKQRGQRQVLLIPQFRYPTNSFGWEVPAGKPEAGESQRAAAKREFREEAGFEAEHWADLPRVIENTGRGNSSVDVFAAAGLTAVGNQLDPTEAIGDAEWFTLTQVEDMLLDRQINTAHTISALGFAGAFINRNPDHPISQIVS